MAAREPEVTARFQRALADQVCRCELCPRHCVIKPGQFGFCLHRRNENGRLLAAQYGRVAALAVDPIEKKPLFHFHPGTSIASVGAIGCNLACKFCQNWHLSTGEASTKYVSPQELAAQAGMGGSIGLAFTYNEPMIWFEYILDTAAMLRPKGHAVVLVTNGYLEAEPFAELTQWVDAMNVDLKGDEEFYRRVAGGKMAPVRRNIETAVRAGVHVEVTNLLVTGANESPAAVAEVVDWLASVSPKIPLHFSRYFPNHRFDAPPTPVRALEEAATIAKKKLEFVYVGNVQLPGASDTRCPQCGATAIKRLGYSVEVVGLTDAGTCASCGRDLAMVV